jgi:threonine/homoserine/homoserine lactone efflux protein
VFALLATQDLPLPHHLPWWMAVAMVAVWAALVVVGVAALRARRARREIRRPKVLPRGSIEPYARQIRAEDD